jgi:hypothetical protein
MSGKSTTIFKILNNAQYLFDPIPGRIVYVYGAWQNNFSNFKNIEFISDLEKVLQDDFFDPSINNVLVLDDLMEEISNNTKASKLFTKYIHHKNISVFFLVQNLYRQGRAMRDIILNCQYMFLFKSSRDVGQIKLLARQLNAKYLVQAYGASIKVPFNFLFIDLHQKTPDSIKLQTNFFAKYRTIFK